VQGPKKEQAENRAVWRAGVFWNSNGSDMAFMAKNRLSLGRSFREGVRAGCWERRLMSWDYCRYWERYWEGGVSVARGATPKRRKYPGPRARVGWVGAFLLREICPKRPRWPRRVEKGSAGGCFEYEAQTNRETGERTTAGLRAPRFQKRSQSGYDRYGSIFVIGTRAHFPITASVYLVPGSRGTIG